MTDTSLDKFDLEDSYYYQVLSGAWTFVCNRIFQNAITGLKYRPSDVVTKATQVYKDANIKTTFLKAQI